MSTTHSAVPPTTTTREAASMAAQYWWLPLVTGILWTLFALIVFRFDYTTVATLSLLVGTACIAAGVVELFAAAAVHGGARFWRIVLGLALAAVGVVAYAHPGNTFTALAAVFAFYLLLRGVADIVMAIATRDVPLWWVGLIAGIAQVALAFWAAGDFGHKAFLLVVWVGASAMIRGVSEIVLAFQIRSASHAA
jgi:uncharacterized membrane protein HdeD (DUF308 family)